MLPSGERAEHPAGVRTVARLAQDRTVADDKCVRRQRPLPMTLRDLQSLGIRQARRGCLRGLTGNQIFVDVRGVDLEGNAERRQDLGAAGG